MDSKLKYIKLFEEFVQKYEQIKKLPKTGAFNINDVEQIRAVVNVLDDHMHYIDLRKQQNDDTGFDVESVTWWIYNKKPTYSYYDSIVDKTDPEFVYKSLINFDDYFRLKHEFRGHNLKNKFRL